MIFVGHGSVFRGWMSENFAISISYDHLWSHGFSSFVRWTLSRNHCRYTIHVALKQASIQGHKKPPNSRSRSSKAHKNGHFEEPGIFLSLFVFSKHHPAEACHRMGWPQVSKGIPNYHPVCWRVVHDTPMIPDHHIFLWSPKWLSQDTKTWLVLTGWNINFAFSHLNWVSIIIPIDALIFFRGVAQAPTSIKMPFYLLNR